MIETYPHSWSELLDRRPELPKQSKTGQRFVYEQNFYREYLEHVPKSVVIEERKKLIGDSYILIPNNFPYSKLLVHLPNVKHYIFWSNVKLDNNQLSSILDRELGDIEYFFYENDTTTKSIPEIYHIQVFINFKDSDTYLKWLDSKGQI
jgi:hypothetical protein